jgi:hypothetical protein
MRQQTKWLVGGGFLITAGLGLAMIMTEPRQSSVVAAGDKPVSEDQVRHKLHSDESSDIDTKTISEGRNACSRTERAGIACSLRQILGAYFFHL